MGQKQQGSATKWSMDEHTLTIDDVCKKYETQFNIENPEESFGLKFRVVSERLAELGYNKVGKRKTDRIVTVFRDGQKSKVVSEELVVGDIVMINSGDIVPADLRILSLNGLKVDNSILTGEKIMRTCTVDKTSENPLETSNILFKEATIVAGSGYAVVVKTGINTLIESILG